jgi:hypothetical protein
METTHTLQETSEMPGAGVEVEASAAGIEAEVDAEVGEEVGTEGTSADTEGGAPASTAGWIFPGADADAEGGAGVGA